MDELKPCPFCGGDRVKVTKPTMWQAWCMDCKAIGAARLTEQEAAEAWNTRASGWIPCSERLPDKGMSVLICGGGGHRVTAYYDPVREVFRLTETDALYYHRKNVTHWMPLPETPKGGANNA